MYACGHSSLPAMNAARVVALLVSLLSLTAASGQIFFSVNPEYLKIKNEGTNPGSRFFTAYPDTGIFTIHNFFPRNFLGNTGLPSPRYFLDYGTPDIGFILFRPPYPNDAWRADDVTYYRSAGPFASLTGIAGSGQLQVFKALFTQSYRNGINLALNFRRYTSKGFYRRQQSYTNNFILSSSFDKATKRFGYYLYIINSSNKHNENGGIRDSVLNDSTMLLPKDLLAVRINGADRDNRYNRFMFNPFLRLSGSDSSRTKLCLQVKSAYTGTRFRYINEGGDPDNFYDHIYQDSIRTADSTRHRQLTNEVSLLLRSKAVPFSASAGVRHEINNYYALEEQVGTNLLLVAATSYGNSDDSTRLPLEVGADVQTVVSGLNAGNYKVSAYARHGHSGGKSTWVLRALMESRNPDYYYMHWRSNHFRWDNDLFVPQSLFQARIEHKLGSLLQTALFYENVSRLLYFDEKAVPAQLSAGNSVSNVGAEVAAGSVIFRHLGLFVKYRYQHTNNNSVARIPQHHIVARIYSYSLLFSKKLQLQLGAQGELFSGFSPYAYMPATQAFYLQNYSSTKPYPFVDVYLNARVRPVSVFLKVENVLQGFVSPDYFFVPGYYQPDRAFRMGITWMFFD